MDGPRVDAPAWTRFLPHYLKPLGYRCYHSGKWQVPVAPVGDAGFDHSFFPADPNSYFFPKRLWQDDRPLPPLKDGDGYYATTAIADRAIGWLREHAGQYGGEPFCLYLAFTAPHFPLHALEEDIRAYRDAYAEGWDRVRERRWQRMRRQGIVNCELSRLEPGARPSWNTPDEELRQQIGPGEVTRAVPWNELSEEQKAFQATKMAIHAAMVGRMDREIGRVLRQVEAMGAAGDTVTLFASDNGASSEQIIRGSGHDRSAPPGSGGSFLCIGPGWASAANSPFRLHKSWVHEGGISSPLIVHWPAGIRERGKLRHDPCHFIDLLPTMLDLAGGKTPPPLPGRSIAPAFRKDGGISRDFLFFHHLDNRAIRVGGWKLVAAGAGGPWELYDMKVDRCEMRNLAERRPDKVRDLAALWTKCEEEFRREAVRAARGAAGAA